MMKINFVTPKELIKIHELYIRSKNIVILTGHETDEIVEELFDSLLQKYQCALENTQEGSSHVFDSFDVLYYKLHKASLDRGGSYIDSPEWLKNKQATINPITKKDDKCFQYAISTALNYQNIKHNPERITKIKLFVNKYDWNGIDFPLHKRIWNKFELNNKTIALNVLSIPYNTKQIRPAYISKYNSDREEQAILFMITDNNKKWHYLFVK